MKRKFLIYVLLMLTIGVSIIAPISCHGQITELALPYPVKLINPKPIDFYYFNTSGTPYTSTSQVTTQVVSAARYQGQTFNVNGAEYWFAAGIADINLVAKSGGGGGITNNASNTELMMSNGTNAVHSGLFSSPSLGDLTMGTSLSGAARNILADGSSANIGLNLFSKGNSPIQLGASLGAQIYGFAISNNTSTPITTLKINHRTINTPAIGIGVFMDFETQTAVSTNTVGTSIGSVSTSITPGSEAFDLVFKNLSSGAGLVEVFRVTSDGRLYGKSLHNNSGSVTGTANQYVASGTYTPTTGSTTNVGSITMNIFNWIRVGNVVTVSGRIDLTPTAASNASILEFSLPISTSLPGSYSLSGSAGETSSAKQSGGISGSGVFGNTAVLLFYATSTGPTNFYCTFTYLIN